MTHKQRAMASGVVAALFGLASTIALLFNRLWLSVAFVLAIVVWYFVSATWMRRGAPNKPE